MKTEQKLVFNRLLRYVAILQTSGKLYSVSIQYPIFQIITFENDEETDYCFDVDDFDSDAEMFQELLKKLK